MDARVPSHWTYENLSPSAELEQGDILSPTDALREVFSTVHPHFRDDKYLGYIVTTQSCDLVRRRQQPKATYINIAVVRPLAQVIHKILGEVAISIGVGAYRSSDKAEAHRLLERVLNQNEQAIGLFYLHDDTDAGIAEPAVAFLRVSIALRAEHYEVLRSARVAKLAPEFRAKLGWLIGNLYVRPATPDWGESEERRKRFEGLIRQFMDDARWVDDEIVDSARRRGVDVSAATPEALEELRPPSRKERAIQEIQAELLRVAPAFPQDTVAKVGNRLRNNGKFARLFRG